MRIIDRYAYNNRLTKVGPAYKFGLAVLVIALCLVLNEIWVGVLVVGWMFYLGVYHAGLPARTFGRLLIAEGSFLLLTSVGVAVSVSVGPSPLPWQMVIGPLTFSSSPEALALMLLLLTRALGATAAMNFLALTTPLMDILVVLRRLRVPETLIDVMVVMYRFIFVLLDTLERMVTAQGSRLGYQTGYWRSMQNAGQLGARLFLNAMARSQRLETAVSARGFNNNLTVLQPTYQPFPRFTVWLVAITATLLLAKGGTLWLS
ncbi:MAG: cobalt ECF transporter T component CbiQ [Chloroflexota bacterium]